MPKGRYKKKYNTKSKMIYKNRKDIKRLKQGIEYKWKDVNVSNTNFNSAGAVTCLNPLSQGDTSNTRTGDQVQARRLMIRGYLNNTHGTPEDGIGRIIVFRCKHSNNAEQTLGLLLEDVDVNGFREMGHKDRYQVYMDETFTYDTSQHTLIPFKFKTKLNNIVQYNANAGAYTDIEANSLWIGYFSTISGTTNDPYFSFRSRFSYCDA